MLLYLVQLFVSESAQQRCSELFVRNSHLLNANNGIPLEIKVLFSDSFSHTLMLVIEYGRVLFRAGWADPII